MNRESSVVTRIVVFAESQETARRSFVATTMVSVGNRIRTSGILRDNLTEVARRDEVAGERLRDSDPPTYRFENYLSAI